MAANPVAAIVLWASGSGNHMNPIFIPG